ncbi:hypothetical protein [Wolbachia endosymbiont (group A) of Brachyopa scutellaris]|uniref:hypothetical protein n=1 Tax=Wolbachia endosymbiont (group A) of Brachyopa scutellaris TaxID=3066140 RepID=UPI0031333D3A
MLTSKLSWIPVSSTGMTGEGGYLDDTIFFLDPSSQGTEMTPSWMKTSISYFHDTILFSGSK